MKYLGTLIRDKLFTHCRHEFNDFIISLPARLSFKPANVPCRRVRTGPAGREREHQGHRSAHAVRLRGGRTGVRRQDRRELFFSRRRAEGHPGGEA